MGSWLDEPGARKWRAQADAADRLRGPGIPLRDLPGYRQGLAAIVQSLFSALDPDMPNGFTASRSASRRVLEVMPQSGPDSLCHESRWRHYKLWGDQAADVCDRRTCGRCLPLKASADRSNH
ncbi:hypothetical protein ACFV2N_37845 [Streptomyces sp. NPDC059680]|uniref:hypothetical protein n=1 Tax=Streptomyces TaxID=1883 RepID=UPI001E492D7C|nr:hypothetical protein [Streptomyces barringtoniae]MCC5480969.1 hypothetical protein [Streptomyces barringtoniae]